MGCAASIPVVAAAGEDSKSCSTEVRIRPSNSQCIHGSASSVSSVRNTAAAINAAMKGAEVDVSGHEPTCDSASSLQDPRGKDVRLGQTSLQANLLRTNPRYYAQQQLNTGTSANVVLAVDRETGNEVAVKLVRRGGIGLRRVEREILNLRLCTAHPHVISFYDLFQTPEGLAIVLQYAALGDVADYVMKHKDDTRGRGLPEDLTRWLFQQLMAALGFCHAMGIVNRDIKLENLLLAPHPFDPHAPLLKLCDFGLSKDEYADSLCKTACGTPEYIPPEVLLGTPGYNGKAADVWSCGVVLYAMLTATFPFSTRDGANYQQELTRTFQRIMKGEFHVPAYISPNARDLLGRIFKANPADRIGLDEIFKHPWFVVNLPPGLEDMNSRLLALEDDELAASCPRSETDVLRCLAEIRVMQHWAD